MTALPVLRAAETERSLTQTEVRRVLRDGLDRLNLTGARVLVVIPDGTRTAPIPMIYQLLGELLGPNAERIDYLIALKPLCENQYGISHSMLLD